MLELPWLSLSKRNFRLDLGEFLFFRSVGLLLMMTGVAAAPAPGLSLPGEALYTNTSCLNGDAVEGWLPTLSYSSRVSLSPAVLLKLLVLEEEREMFDRPFSFSLIKGLERGGMKEGHVAVTRAACP